ncbi:uncharacterized protein TRIADDRAFT_54185 [Trichoplax adhaerens]|uniref:Importin N-terminal domain-containing protein n=1 Tax=Trichoplax adhaerens TaxID=10228 RepID=B3RRC4_TRIAD|nr:hypothetical protein TRIADDRAFT_54185 [Trichoplax adhaerens]EDV26853.1 hypothetical protein TRIADDRAFT_54185 [Trichoplax adhaerens]|eukprot:XP_002110849.1 hypothetical protein TRIADDRAFT_54185 [Trichoplax adhaerens]
MHYFLQNNNELIAAQKYVEQAAERNLPEFLVALVNILANTDKSQVVRMAAGINLKNSFTSKDPAIKLQYQERWKTFSNDVRYHIKNLVLQTLGTEPSRPSSAAQCVASIACVELPFNVWPEVIPTLVRNVTNQHSTEALKESSLEAIGYICSDIADPDVISSKSNDILTAIILGMRKEEPSNYVRLAAAKALLNSLEFTKANFEKTSERHYIMQVLCEATQSPDEQIRVAALQNLVRIVTLYYQYMEHYMGPALFAITIDAMTSHQDAVALQGIEFWSSICDEEVDLAIEAADAAEAGRPPEQTSKHYVKGALGYLVPILLQTLTKQSELDDEDDWNPCKAAGVCLMLVASCCENDVIGYILPFIKENIVHSDWQYRDAAVMALGSILEGPDPAVLLPVMNQAMPLLIGLMENDNNIIVCDSVAWTIGRICELLPEVAINPDVIESLIGVLKKGLAGEPRVASNVCWALSSLAEAAFDNEEGSDSERPDSYCLSPYYNAIVDHLLKTTTRQEANSSNLRSAAYESLMELIKNSAKDCYPTIQLVANEIMQRLQAVLSMEGTVQSADRSQFVDLQCLLCATLQSVLRRIQPSDVSQWCDSIMKILLLMFNSSTGRTGTIQEDALMTVGTLVEVTGINFMIYMDSFKPFLLMGLKNVMEHQVCLAAVGIVSDLCRAFGHNFVPHADEIMSILIKNLGDASLDRSVKPHIFSTIGDIAMAIEGNFKVYLEIVFGILHQASQTEVKKEDFDLIDYLNLLRESCLETYTGIAQGLKGSGDNPNVDINILRPEVPRIMQFIDSIAIDEDHSDGTISTSAGLIGDLCDAYGSSEIQSLVTGNIQGMLQEGLKSKETKTKQVCAWALKELHKVK